jgi:preprotein translocase subunit SecE
MSTILYKPGQGYWTRLGTAVGCGMVLMFGAMWAFGEVGKINFEGEAVFYQGAVAGSILLVGFLALYWLIYANRKVGEFMIATEGEMRKVNWSTRKEIMGSTWVVIAISVIIALILFIVDLGFSNFFTWIKVLEVR